MNKCKLLLTAAILNNEKEAEIYDWLKLIVPEYKGVFNKRFETWINKKASERFGDKTIENWGMNGESKTYPRVNFYMRRDDFMDTVKYEFSFNYEGKTVGYDYDTKTDVLRDHNENEKLFGIKSAEEIVDWSLRVAANRRENVEKMQDNLRNLPALEQERIELKLKLEAYNNKISYAISDQMRIK